MVYGTTLRVPGELVSPHPTPVPDPVSFATRLCTAMQSVKAILTHSHTRPYLPHSLSSSSHVLVRHDAVRNSLQQPYDGPYKVIKRSVKYYTLLINDKQVNVSIDRLKPAFLDKEQESHMDSSTISPSSIQYPSPISLLLPSAVSTGKTTRCGEDYKRLINIYYTHFSLALSLSYSLFYSFCRWSCTSVLTVSLC